MVRRVFSKDLTVLASVQALGVTSDWYTIPMGIYVDNWETLSTITKTTVTTTLSTAGYTFDHDE